MTYRKYILETVSMPAGTRETKVWTHFEVVAESTKEAVWLYVQELEKDPELDMFSLGGVCHIKNTKGKLVDYRTTGFILGEVLDLRHVKNGDETALKEVK